MHQQGLSLLELTLHVCTEPYTALLLGPLILTGFMSHAYRNN